MNSDDPKEFEIFNKLWKQDPRLTLQAIFYTCLQNKQDGISNEKLCVFLLWLYECHYDILLKVVPLVVGLASEITFSNPDEIFPIAKEEHEKCLEKFVSDNSKETFRRQFRIEAINKLSEFIPEFGSMLDLEKLESTILQKNNNSLKLKRLQESINVLKSKLNERKNTPKTKSDFNAFEWIIFN